MNDRTNLLNGQAKSAVMPPRTENRPVAPPPEPPAPKAAKSGEPRRLPIVEWFYNLPIGRKQLLALIACELVPILGLGIGSTIVLTNSLRSQLLEQAKSEVAVTEINYNIKVNQMGFGSRGQSDNIAIINISKDHLSGFSTDSGLREKVKQILQNEVKARKMEFATLVGKDLKIITSANNDRRGEIFDPNNLVSEVLKNPQQVKASVVINAIDLTQEGAPLPKGFNSQAQHVLMRYVITPVRDVETKAVIGALVFGDMVNDKLPIVEGTLKAFGGGYSAVYLRQPSGQFALATALDQGNTSGLAQARPNVPLADPAWLGQAIAASKGQAVTQRLPIGDQTYTIAAKALPEKILETPDGPTPVFSDQPTAILVRGTPETNLNSLLQTSLRQEGLVLLASIVVLGAWSVIFRRLVLDAIMNLKQTTQVFAQGDRTARATVSSRDEVGQLAVAFNTMADSITLSEAELATEAQRAQQVSTITLRIRQSLNRTDILSTTTREVRQALQTDRVVVYQFTPDWSGTIVAEAVVPPWRTILHETVNDPFRVGLIDQYRNGRVRTMNDITAEELTDCHRDILDGFQIKASIVAPIIKGGELLGLLSAHQCSGARVWRTAEISLFSQLAAQIGYALDQAETLAQREQARQSAEALSEDQRQQKETLQQQLLDLLSNVEGAASGDLTVRADVTSGEIGIVADFFNAIVENLRQVVTKVKDSATQVNSLLGENEGAMRVLADEALLQAEETTRILDSVEQMTQSIQVVAENARQAATIAHTASTTAVSSEAEMELTVQNILGLRDTINAAATQVKQLGDSTQQISRIVSLIDEVAVQTDMLAINAGMEAARAGAQGRGFAIVAAEVGELAARSAAATREISYIVDNIQRETKAVVSAMNQGTTQVMEGAHLVKNAKQSLGQIVQVSRQIDDLVQSISQATVSQASTSRSVTNLIKAIAQVSVRTSDSSRQVSGALRQTVEVAQELQSSVETFEVGQA
jgi:twitching motility protein PilJ